MSKAWHLIVPECSSRDWSMRQKVPEPFRRRSDITVTGLFRLPVLRQHRLAICSPGGAVVALQWRERAPRALASRFVLACRPWRWVRGVARRDTQLPETNPCLGSQSQAIPAPPISVAAGRDCLPICRYFRPPCRSSVAQAAWALWACGAAWFLCPLASPSPSIYSINLTAR